MKARYLFVLGCSTCTNFCRFVNGSAKKSFSACPLIRSEFSFYVGLVENKSLEQRNSVVG